MTKEKLLNLLKTTQDQNILWIYLLKNNDDYNWIIVYNSNCSLEILKILSKDKSWHIRERTIYHPNCSLELLEKLSEDEDWLIRQATQQKLNDKRKSL